MKQLESGCGGAPIIVDVHVQSPLWNAEAKAIDVLRNAIAAAAAQIPAQGEVSVVLTDDATIQVLNRKWRSVDKPTNVLSFPAAPAYGSGIPALLGDIVVAYETVTREAKEENKPILDHLAHLVVHGYLHLMGYDHQSDSEANVMEDLERGILNNLGIADPNGAYEAGAA